MSVVIVIVSACCGAQWSNRTQYSQVVMHKLPEVPAMADMPAPSGAMFIDDSPRQASDNDEEDEKLELLASKLEQLTPELATLSTVPAAQWQVLPKLDTVRQRNKPKQPPKKPEAAPFFLEQVFILERQRNSCLHSGILNGPGCFCLI